MSEMRAGRGFTLAEILIVVAVFSLMSVIMGRLISESYSSYKDQKQFLQVQHDARFALEVLASELQDATAVPATISPPAGAVTFTTRLFCQGAGGTADKSATVPVTYAMAAGVVTRSVVGSPQVTCGGAPCNCPVNASIIMRNMTQFSVERPTNGPVQLTVEVTIGSKRSLVRTAVTPRGQATTRGGCYNPLGGPCP